MGNFNPITTTQNEPQKNLQTAIAAAINAAHNGYNTAVKNWWTVGFRAKHWVKLSSDILTPLQHLANKKNFSSADIRQLQNLLTKLLMLRQKVRNLRIAANIATILFIILAIAALILLIVAMCVSGYYGPSAGVVGSLVTVMILSPFIAIFIESTGDALSKKCSAYGWGADADDVGDEKIDAVEGKVLTYVSLFSDAQPQAPVTPASAPSAPPAEPEPLELTAPPTTPT